MYKLLLTFILKRSMIFLLFQPNFSFAHVIQLDDKRFIAYTDTGSGIPLILIHAFPADQRLWKPQIKGLKNYFRIITLDLWGFGNSSPTNGHGYA